MKNTIQKIWRFYVDGFRGMTLGKTLWLIILVKLFIMFFILKLPRLSIVLDMAWMRLSGAAGMPGCLTGVVEQFLDFIR